MFYNFNRHKQQVVQSEAVAMDELVKRYNQRRKAGQRYLADQMSAKMSRLPVTLQLAIYLYGLILGTSYCICLILPDPPLHPLDQLMFGSTNSHQTIQAATPSPKQQAFQHYLDSLEKTFVADSILQSQRTIKDHAEKSIHP